MLTERLEFVPDRDVRLFAAVPAAPAVFLLRGNDAQAEPYVSKTANLRRRLQRLLGPPEERTKKLSLRDRVSSIEFTTTGSDFESAFVLYRVLRENFPKTYSKRLRFRFAPLVKLHLDNQYPRASVTTRPGRLNSHSLYYGPFLSRSAAEKFMNDSLDFFKMRRCVDDLHPDPAFHGCIYSDMKMCLAPCFKGCGDQEYSAEVGRVQAYFDSSGNSLSRELSAQRESASSALQFEEAAAIHAKLEKLRPVVGQLPEIARRLDRFAALVIQPCHTPETVTFFRVRGGIISAPTSFCIQKTEQAKSESMESRVQVVLDAIGANPSSALETAEHLALLKRWYFRSRRVGEIFFADDKGIFPMRRIVRGISRVLHGEKPEEKFEENSSVRSQVTMPLTDLPENETLS